MLCLSSLSKKALVKPQAWTFAELPKIDIVAMWEKKMFSSNFLPEVYS